MRTLSSLALQAINSQNNAQQVWLQLVTISHPQLPTPITVCNDTKNQTSNGVTFVAWPFLIALPNEKDEEKPKTTLEIDNVDQSIVIAMRSIPIDQPATVTLQIALASQPNTIERTINFVLIECSYDAMKVVASLSSEEVFTEPFPAWNFTPANHPALFVTQNPGGN